LSCWSISAETGNYERILL